MESLEPDHAIAARVWWAFTWRSFLISMAIAMAAGLLLGILGVLLGLQGDKLDSLTGTLAPLIGLVVYIAVSIEVMRRVLKKKFKTFQLAIIPRQD